jgi:NAD(P)-dependent dehydrogenase (short-subunit alcohol dehydrogenase family)
MKSIVITGSTRGIGFALAGGFLERGCRVTISGRSQASVDNAIEELSMQHGPDSLHGQPCDVTEVEQVRALWAASRAHWGTVDIWINNAGQGNPYLPFWEQEPGTMRAIVEANVLGTMYGTLAALDGMREQGAGQIYNMEGFGSDGRTRPGLTVYASTKSAVRTFTRSLLREIEETGDDSVLLGTLSPGMVLTDLLISAMEARPAELDRVKRVFNIIADRAETVAPWLVDRILANEQQGAHIAWLTRAKLMGRFLAAPFNRRDLFADR